MIEVAAIAAKVGRKVFSDPNTPEAVKNGLLNVAVAMANAKKRNRWRKQYGVAPSFFTMDPTSRCNLHCDGCYAGSEAKGDDLSLETMSNAVEEMRTNFGVHFVVLSGGEPFLRWSEIAQMAARFRDVTFMVYTNGTLLSEDIVARMAQLGNIFPAISVEGWENETDARRGRGHFNRIKQVMDALKKAGIVFGFSATATSQNAGIVSSDKFIDFLIEKGCVFGWYFIYVPIGRNPDVGLMVSPKQRLEMAENLYRWRREGKPIIIADFWNDGPLVGGCIAGGRRYLHLKADGSISPCVFCTLAAANINKIDPAKCKFGPITDTILYSSLFRKYRKAQMKIRNVAAPCPIIDDPYLLREAFGRSLDATILSNTPPGFFDPGSVLGEKLYGNAHAWRECCHQGQHLRGSVYANP